MTQRIVTAIYERLEPGPGAYVIFWEVAQARIFDPVFDGRASRDQEDAFFRWLEWMALSDDRQIIHSMMTELCERIGNDRAFTEPARPRMGLRSLERFLEIEQQWRSTLVSRIEVELDARLP